MMSFSLSGGVEVLGFISPTDPLDTYPVIDPIYGIDGFRNVDLISDLDLIPNPRRRAGMVVGISGGTQYYKLNPSPWNGDITDWSVFNLGGGTFRAMYDMAINVQSVSILNALEGTSIPDGASDSYTKTIPLPFVNPDLVYCVIQSRNFFNQGFVPITFGFTTQGAGFITTGSTSNSDLRFIVTNNYTEVRIAGINRLDGISSTTKFIDDSGVTIPGGIDFPTYSQQNNNLVGIYSGPGGTSGILGYTSSSGAFQSHSVLKSAYINGNNLVLLFKKRILTTSELWTRLNINVYNIS